MISIVIYLICLSDVCNALGLTGGSSTADLPRIIAGPVVI